MNISSVYDRQKRNLHQMYHPMHSSIASYWTEALHKREMKQEFGDDYYLNNFHLIPDPLKKNLADTLITNDKPKKPAKMSESDHKVPLPTFNMPVGSPRKEENTGLTLGGIGSFFSGVLNVLSGAMFRSRSPESYYDCFDGSHQGSPSWQRAKINVQDKNGQAPKINNYDVPPSPNLSTDMNPDSRTVTSCENKLNQVLNLLAPRKTSSPVWVRKKPKRAYVDPGSVSDSFDDAFSPEDYISLSDDSYIEYYSPMQHQNGELFETVACKTKTMLHTSPVEENTDVVDVNSKRHLELNKDNTVSKTELEMEQCNIQLEKDCMQSDSLNSGQTDLQSNESGLNLATRNESETLDVRQLPLDNKNTDSITNCQLVSTCEDKLSRLKALLLERRKNSRHCVQFETPKEPTTDTSNTVPIEKKPADKHYKNPNRRTDKRCKGKLKCRIEDELLFANEISLGTPPSIESSPTTRPRPNFGEYFDEISGRFRSASIGSEDSFQIVFNDSPKPGRIRTTSDCDSEDSFIVFEDSPESCYMSNDVFGDSGTDTDVSDSGCGMMTCKLAHTLTRTVSNLADDSLYVESEDEVDFGNMETVSAVPEVLDTGLLLTERKKLLRKNLPAKKVQFSLAPPKVHVMRVWAFAAKQARAGHWERYAIDRERFKRRIADVDVAVSWVLRPQHRKRVMFQRFMPWWHQLKRKELAEKKEREEKLKEENERENKELETEEKEEVTEVKEVAEGKQNTQNGVIGDQLQRTEYYVGEKVVAKGSSEEKTSNFVNDKDVKRNETQKEGLKAERKGFESNIVDTEENVISLETGNKKKGLIEPSGSCNIEKS